jgi:hypothetical protein
MIISVWDEISGEWSEMELDIPSHSRDPKLINKAVGAQVAGDGPTCDEDESESPDGWDVKSHSFTGPILTIESRSDRNHLCIIVVNYEAQ